MHEIDWYGNDGRFTPDAGTVEVGKCGVCGAQMDVRRNILGPRGFAQALGGGKSKYDLFTCPHQKEDWHKRILRLKEDVRREEGEDDQIGLEKMKQAAEKEILELLKTHTT